MHEAVQDTPPLSNVRNARIYGMLQKLGDIPGDAKGVAIPQLSRNQ